MKKSSREILFFVLVFLLFYLCVKIMLWWIQTKNSYIPQTIVYLLTSVVYTLLIVGVYFLSKIGDASENFWDVSPAAMCKGGPYMWQGDSDTAKMCREMAKNTDGRCAIASYNCPTGFIGTPKIPFYYSPLSGDSWKNERCTHTQPCSCSGEDLASFERQVPFNTNTNDDGND